MSDAIWTAAITTAGTLAGAGLGVWATFVHERRRRVLEIRQESVRWEMEREQEVSRRAAEREQLAFQAERDLYTAFARLIERVGSQVMRIVVYTVDRPSPEGAQWGVEAYVELRTELREVVAHLYLQAPEDLATVAARAFTAAEQVCAGAIFGADAASMRAAQRDLRTAREEFRIRARQRIVTDA